ncbi:branched-chain amino acid ABC transporter substrate-binding protein [Verticiella sediminum]|uniref:Branched-chain amino acid ABC transporter substrate-binding protein n=1 Tax=Verticiella sediminum TaxID=1247510 RepID=A0A556ADS1_9BURK|nr:branched-chain amino acid ABC transporter substrate-binding protein [Verticiella sediminum]TSH91026.1 branched-chain amino acid ABC transporter substrate-binding protein [Verticiella sediminum]
MNIRFRQLPLALALALALALGALALGTSAAARADITIAIAGPMTGPVTQYGDMVKEGVNTLVEQVNAAGGVDGEQLRVVTLDDGCEPKQAPVVANRVVNDKIGFVVGHVCSGATIAAADIYDDEGVVMVSPSATSPALTDGKSYHTIFRTIGRDDQQGPAAAEFIIASVKPTKVAVLHDKQSYGQGIATAVRDDLKKAGIEIALFEGINAGDSDYSAIITKLRSAGVDFVYYGGYHPEMGLLLRQANEQGLKARFMGPEGVGNNDINAIAGKAADGMLVTLPADFTQDPKNAEIVKAFKDKGRDPGGAFQMTAYTAAQVLVDAMKGAKSKDPEEVAKYLHANTFDTPIGPVSFNEQGDLEKFEFDVFEWSSDGTKKSVK